MNFKEWIGKSVSRRDTISPEQLRRFEAMLNHHSDTISEGDKLTLCSHWAYFTPVLPQSELTVQGYPRHNDLLPPIDQSSRLWLGGRLQFKHELFTGTPATRHTTIVDIKADDDEDDKVYVSLQHQISAKGSLCITEDQHYLYRHPVEKGAHPTRTEPIDIDPDWEKSTKPDSIQLFRFSALTFNAHRIHYDQNYAKDMEGYPNVIVHGPLLLLMALEAFRSDHDGKKIEEITYELRGPVYLGEQVKISGRSSDNQKTELRITGPENNIALKASVKWTYDW